MNVDAVLSHYKAAPQKKIYLFQFCYCFAISFLNFWSDTIFIFFLLFWLSTFYWGLGNQNWQKKKVCFSWSGIPVWFHNFHGFLCMSSIERNHVIFKAEAVDWKHYIGEVRAKHVLAYTKWRSPGDSQGIKISCEYLWW